MAFALGSPLLEVCVLVVLERGDTYGYALTQEVKESLEISESTLYPVLRRLERDGYLYVYDSPYQGRNRRYYAITDVGRICSKNRREEWDVFKDGIEHLLRKGVSA